MSPAVVDKRGGPSKDFTEMVRVQHRGNHLNGMVSENFGQMRITLRVWCDSEPYY